MGAVAQNHGTDLTTGNVIMTNWRDSGDLVTYRVNSVALPTLGNAPAGGSWDSWLERDILFHNGPFQEYLLALNNTDTIGIETNIKNRYNI